MNSISKTSTEPHAIIPPKHRTMQRLCSAGYLSVSERHMGVTWLKTATPTVSSNGRWVEFRFDENKLPERRSPTQTGDFVRVVEDPRYRRVDAYFVMQLGEKAVLATLPSERDLPECVMVDMSHLMLIHNFWKVNTSWWPKFGHEHEERLQRVLAYVQARLNGEGRLLAAT